MVSMIHGIAGGIENIAIKSQLTRAESIENQFVNTRVQISGGIET
jgi:hypothetical protein